jgi:hypothetical protein
MLSRVALVRTASFIRVKYLVFLCSVRRLQVTASVVPSSPILVTLMKETLSSTVTSVLIRATRRNITQDTIFIVTAVKTSNFHLFFSKKFAQAESDSFDNVTSSASARNSIDAPCLQFRSWLLQTNVTSIPNAPEDSETAFTCRIHTDKRIVLFILTTPTRGIKDRVNETLATKV